MTYDREAIGVLSRLLLLFIAVPLVELALLLLLAEYTAWWVSLLLVISSGAVGAMLARQQGLATLLRVRQQLRQGQVPTDALLDGMLIFFAGGLLLTPGVLTDVLGLSLLIPRGRQLYKALLAGWFRSNFKVTTAQTGTPPPSKIVDSYVVPPTDSESDRTE